MVDKTMPSHGMAVNWDPGKTEVIVLWAGNAPEPAWGFAGTDVRAGSYNSTNIWGPWYLRLPHQPWKSGKGSRRPLAPFILLPRKFSWQQEIDIHLRTRLFNALVVSILLYNSEIWVPTRMQVRWIHMFYLRCLRRMGRFPKAPFLARNVSPMQNC